MAKVIKDITVSWSWSGDTYAIDGFNVAITPSAENPKTKVTTMLYVAGNATTYTLKDVTLDSAINYTAWVQAVYDGGDSSWVSAGNLTVSDDGNATIATKTQVDTAQSNATTALNTLADIASDNKLTPGEKSDTLKEWNIITGEKANIDAQADVYSITAEKKTYGDAYIALGTYLNGGTAWTSGVPLWLIADATNGLGETTTIDGPTFRGTFKAYYDARTALLKKVQDSAKGYVDKIQIGGRNLAINGDFSRGTTAGSATAPTGWTFWGARTAVWTSQGASGYNNPRTLYIGMDTVDSGIKQTLSVLTGTQYTLSFSAGKETLSTYYTKIQFLNSSGTVLSTQDLSYAFTAQDTIQSFTFTTPSTFASAVFMMGGTATTYGNGYLMRLGSVKLEKGSHVTDWTPAPEDVDAAVSTAQASATTANSALADIANDNKLVASEKSDTLKEWNIITGEKANVDAQADVYGITTEKTTYGTAYTALGTYLNGGTALSAGTTPLWLGTDTTNGLAKTTTIDGPTFRTKFSDYYNAKIALLKKVQDAAKGYVMKVAVGYDSTFEAGLSYWSADTWAGTYTGPDINNTRTDVVVASGDGANGGNAIKFTNTNGNTVIYSRYPIAVDVNRTYKVRTRVKTLTGTVGTNVHLGIVTYDGSLTEITGGAGTHRWGSTGGKYSTDNTWTTIEWTITGTGDGSSQFRAGTAYIRTCVLINYTTTGVTSEVDSLEFFDVTEVTKAQTDASTAISKLTDIADDNKLTSGEKQDTQREWTKIQNEKASIDGQADTYSIVTEKTAYGTAYTALSDYITTLLSDLTTTVTIDGATFRSKFNGYYTAREALLLKVAQSTKARMDSISIGGRNLFRNTNFTGYAGATDYWGAYLVTANTIQADSGTLSGKSVKVTVSGAGGFYQRFRSDKSALNQSAFTSGTSYMLTGKLKADAGATVTGMTISFEGTTSNVAATLTSSWKSFSLPFIGDGTHDTITFYLSGAGSYYLADVKVEEGNRATTWTPAPEDTDTAVTKAQGDATAALGSLTDIASDSKLTPVEKHSVLQEWNIIAGEKATIDAQADLYSITTEKATYGTAYTDLAKYLNAGTAWTSGDPLWLSGTAVPNSSPAVTYFNSTTDIVGTTFRTNFKTYYDARTALLKKVDDMAKSTIDNISIGGRNLLRSSDFSSFTAGNFPAFNTTTQAATTTSITLASGEVIPFLTISSTTGQAINTIFAVTMGLSTNDATRFSVVSGQQYTLSFLVAAHGNTANPLSYCYIINDGGTDQLLAITDITKAPSYGSFTSPFALTVYKYSVTFTSSYTSSTSRIRFGSRTSANFTGTGSYGLFYIARPQLETGNRASDWTPAPEDVAASVTKVRTDLRLTAALPSTITMDGNGFTATTTSDPNAYARMDYRGMYIKGGALWIDGGLAATDGMNLVPNSSGKVFDSSGNATGWQSTVPVEMVDGRVSLKTTIKTATEATYPGKVFKVKASTTYSWGFWTKQTANCKGIDVYFLGQTSSQKTTAYTLVKQLKTGVVPAVFTYYSGTFTTDSVTVSGYIRIDNNGSSDAADATAWFSEIMVVEGDYSSKQMPAWGPAAEDTVFTGQDYNGVKMDATKGIQVTSAKNVLTMNATDGIKLTRTVKADGTVDNTNVLYIDTNGNLALQGAIALQAGSDITWGSNGANPPTDWLGSRGDNLVTNGNGYLKDKTNFSSPSITYDDADLPDGAYGAFTYTGTGKSLFSDEFIPIDPNQTYQISAMAKSSMATGMTWSLGYYPHDIDKNPIIDDNFLYLAGSLTTLAQDLKPGDTIVYLTSAAGWDNTTSTTDNSQRRLMFWDYQDSTDYIYPAETYTRHISGNGAWDDVGLNKTANTITLKAAWTGTLVPKTTKVSQGWSGSYYMYTGASAEALTTDWQYYSGMAGSIIDDGKSNSYKFPPGTRGVKIYFASSSTTSGTLKIANVSVTTAVRQSDFTGQNIAAKIVADDSSLKLIASNIDISGKVTFTALDPTDSFTEIFAKMPDGSTVIDGSKIATKSIMAEDVVFTDLTIQNAAGKPTFKVTTDGDVSIQGTVQSINYVSKSAGWIISADGSAEFNGATFRGNIEAGYVNNGVYTANAGIVTAGTSAREIRFWAGANPTSAPFKVYSNGDLEATQGSFTGTFSGKVTVGNITIQDDAASSNRASITIADNNASPKVTLTETAATFLNGSAIFGNASATFMNVDSTNKKLKFGAEDMSIDYTNNKLTMKQYDIQGVTDGLTFTSAGTGLNDFIFTNPTGDAVAVIHGTLQVDTSITVNSKVTMRKALDTSGNVVGMDFVIN